MSLEPVVERVGVSPPKPQVRRRVSLSHSFVAAPVGKLQEPLLHKGRDVPPYADASDYLTVAWRPSVWRLFRRDTCPSKVLQVFHHELEEPLELEGHSARLHTPEEPSLLPDVEQVVPDPAPRPLVEVEDEGPVYRVAVGVLFCQVNP